MNNWTAPQRPVDHAEQRLVTAILDKIFPSGSTLPGERDLSAQLGVTRPTLREALRRLERDGWLTISQGKPTRVNNFWQEGGLNVLGSLLRYCRELPPNFVSNLLDVRLVLAPAYVRLAVENAPEKVVALLSEHFALPDTPAAFAAYDWKLHHALSIASGNPVYTLILNGFAGFYIETAILYFADAAARAASRNFYANLSAAAQQGDTAAAEQLTRDAMQQSIILWKQDVNKTAN